MELPIRTERLDLRDFRTTDEEEVHHYASDPVVTRHLSWGPNSREETRAFLHRMEDEAAVQPRRDWGLAVVHRESGVVIGGCSLMLQREPGRPDGGYGDYELGYVLRQDWWGKGCGSELVRALTGFGFRGLGAHRIHANVDTENAASARLLERLGFRREGHHRRDVWIRDGWRDTFVYTLLEDEWPTG